MNEHRLLSYNCFKRKGYRMSQPIILVVGATGMLGTPVAERLLREGYRVRALVRNPEAARQRLGEHVEYASGDVRDEAQVRAALRGCAGVHISLQGHTLAEFEAVEHQGGALVARLAAEQGVGRISYVSGAMVSAEANSAPQQYAKYQAEQAIRQSGVAYTIFKPTFFMETLPLSVQGSRAIVVGGQRRPLRYVAASDFAGLVARAFRTPEAAGKDLFVYGPQALTPYEATATYCRIAAPHAKISTTPLWMMRALNTLFLRGALSPYLTIVQLAQRLGEPGDPAATERILGAPTTTLEQWCQQRTAPLTVEQGA
ncbi:SDR family NAD(P)-dependent oxidoreductase [Chloroflexia bacterium SDU3-3]|nr:SDR family NAD(P)-dependent oxidoreductase [Chloroflexia bacterium SDU3-3]